MIGCDSFGDRNLFFVQNRFFLEFICDFDFLRYLCTRNGGLAQLARALAWHARGHRFDPDILHQSGCHFDDRFFYSLFALEEAWEGLWEGAVGLTTVRD